MARYWVGGAGSWSQIAHWSASDGGGGGETVPDAATDVYLTAASGGGTVTIDVVAYCRDFDAGAFGGNITGGGNWFASGSWAWNSGGSAPTNSGVLTFNSTAAGETILSNGRAFPCAVTLNGAGGEWTLSDALVVDAAKTLTLTTGTFVDAGYTVTCGLFFASGGSAKVINATAATWTLTWAGGSATPMSMGAPATTTLTSVPALLDLTGAASATQTIASGAGNTWNDLRMASASATATYSLTGTTVWRDLTLSAPNSVGLYMQTSTPTFRHMTLTGFVGTWSGNSAMTITGNVTLGAGMTMSETGTKTLTGATSAVTHNGVTWCGQITYNNAANDVVLAAGFTVASGYGVVVTAANSVTIGNGVTISVLGAAGLLTLTSVVTTTSIGTGLFVSGTLTHGAGTLVDNGNDVSVGAFTSSAGVRTLNLTGDWTITNGAWTTAATDLTATAVPPLLTWPGTAPAARGFAPGAVSYASTDLIVQGAAGAGTFTTTPTAGGTARDITLSGSGWTYQHTTAVTQVWRHFTASAFTGTYNITRTNQVTGNVAFAAGAAVTALGTWIVVAAAGTQTFTSAGLTIGAFTKNCAGATVQLLDDMTISGNITNTAGTLDLNGCTITAGNGVVTDTSAGAAGGGSAVIGSSVIVPLGRCAC